MPRHLAVDANVISGTIVFNYSKVGTARFLDVAGNQVLFSKAPRLTLTVLNSTSTIPFRTAYAKVGNLYAGFTIGFQAAQNCEVEWQATERE